MKGLASRRGPLAALVLASGFAAVALVTRLPFQDRTLFISDSVRYALALERYDMTAGRPHPPGNPLYVAIIGLLDTFSGDPVLALVLFSALASGAAFFFAYLLTRDLAGETAGWLAAGLLMVSPLFWFFGGVGMPATGEAALSLHVRIRRVGRRAHEAIVVFPTYRDGQVLRSQVIGSVGLPRPNDGERSDHVDLLPNRMLEIEWSHNPPSIPNRRDAARRMRIECASRRTQCCVKRALCRATFAPDV